MPSKTRAKELRPERGNGGETHQLAGGASENLTTNQGTPISDNQNSLKSGMRGPTLLEDFILREKINHFDHERIPERIVHARGSAAHGIFRPYKSMSHVTMAHFLSGPRVETPVFARFSTVAGGAGSVDMARDVRGFAVKFYTQEGNFDLVGNNIPVFFIQDAIKFPDLIHAVKMEADRGFPQNASAHDTFWDFISLTPESMHMVMWVMSDRAIPRSLRLMEGFGVHTFRLVNAAGEYRFVKFHWRPVLGTSAVLWDEAVKICGADQDYHRRDLYEAIEKGHYPEFEFAFQVFDQKFADSLPFDVLDPTKLIPEETLPLEKVGKMILNRNPDNFFAENEQVAFCPSHLVRGLDFSDDPLLQGRLFSYLDTQLSRLGGPNFHQIPINRPKCPFANMQRDGHMQMEVPTGRANYEPNSLPQPGPRESPVAGFRTIAAPISGEKVRLRADSFSDHYSQARLFYRSVTPQEQQHIGDAIGFELGKVEMPHIRKRMLGHLHIIDPSLAKHVEQVLGMAGMADLLEPARNPIDLPLSPALRLYERYAPTLQARKVGILLGEGFDGALLASVRKSLDANGALVTTIGARIAGVKNRSGQVQPVDAALAGSPSVLFEAVLVLASEASDEVFAADPDAVGFVMDAKRHQKAIGAAVVDQLLAQAGAADAPGLVDVGRSAGITEFIKLAEKGKVWATPDANPPAPPPEVRRRKR